MEAKKVVVMRVVKEDNVVKINKFYQTGRGSIFIPTKLSNI